MLRPTHFLDFKALCCSKVGSADILGLRRDFCFLISSGVIVDLWEDKERIKEAKMLLSYKVRSPKQFFMVLQDTRGNSLAGFWTLPEIDSCWRSAQPLNGPQIVSLLRIDHMIFYGQLSFGGLAELSSV